MNNAIYNNAKQLMRSEAKKLKAQSTDKPYIREVLNNQLDQQIRQFNHYEMKETITKKQSKLYANWLANFTCTLHP